MGTPSQALAETIVNRFVREGLMTAEVAKKLLPKLADGKLRAEDWRLPIELSRDKAPKS